MKVDTSTRTIVGILVVVAAAVAFWMLLISPKRNEAGELTSQVEGLQATLSQTQSEVAAADEAKRKFPQNYHQLVTLGTAVPASDETASLIVQLHSVAHKSGNGFDSIQLNTAEGATSEEAPASTEGTEGTVGSVVPPTEAEAALAPLGAGVGPAGLGVMPYSLIFTGSFFHIADFIKGIDSLVQTENPGLTVDGRLITINGFSLEESDSEFPRLEGNFSVNTYVAPPGQGLTAGATEAAPEGESAESVEGGEESTEETTEGTPSASVTENR